MKNKIKIILILTITIIITSSITAYATYKYLAKDITYTKEDGTNVSVQEALNDLYNKPNVVVYESGEFSEYIKYAANYKTVTIQLNKNYEEEDNAKLVIKSITPEINAIYYSSKILSNKIVGNTVSITLLNFAGSDSYSTTYTVTYDIIKYNE